MVEFEDGRIKTSLGDMCFLGRVMKAWGEYNEDEVDAIWGAASERELTDEWLKSEGFDILQNTYFVPGDMITLLKVGRGEWVVQDASPLEMEELVDLINQCFDDCVDGWDDTEETQEEEEEE